MAIRRNKPYIFLNNYLNLGIVLACSCAWVAYRVGKSNAEDQKGLQTWLQQYRLIQYAHILDRSGITSIDQALSVDFLHDQKLLSFTSCIQLNQASEAYKEQLILREWLREHNLEGIFARLQTMGVMSLGAVTALSERDMDVISSAIKSQALRSQWYVQVTSLTSNSELLGALKNMYLKKIKMDFGAHRWTYSEFILAEIFIALLSKVLCAYIKSFLAQPMTSRKTLMEMVTGSYLEAQLTRVNWGWQETPTVGNTLSFKLKFRCRNRLGYPISKRDPLLVEIFIGTSMLPANVSFPAVTAKRSECYIANVTFPVHKAGNYKISIMLNAKHIPGSPFMQQVRPGPLEPRNTQFVKQSSIILCNKGSMHSLIVEPRDKYDNLCEIAPHLQPHLFSFDITECGTLDPYYPQCDMRLDEQGQRLMFCVEFDREGCYQIEATYSGTLLKNGRFNLLVLEQTDADFVQKSVARKSQSTYHEGRLLSYNNCKLDKAKKVYCYISPKQFTIKEFIMKIFPKRLITFRVSPSTRFQFLGTNNYYNLPGLRIEDGSQPPVTLALKSRNIVTAVFTHYLLKNIGGSEIFKEKQEFFHHEIRQFHSKRPHDRMAVKIYRNNLLGSAYKAAKHFTTSDWCRNFEISFPGEEGLDWGGLRREFFELLGNALFDPQLSGLFTRFKEDDPQALVHPNHYIPEKYKLKHYEFAGRIVGKCLYESALGRGYSQHIKARLSRSFLAQLIGLRVNFKYFEHDDPELYVTKIKYLLENDAEDVDLCFEEEEFRNGKLVKTVELIPNGSNTPVTDANKLQYLDALAQYRLSNRVKPQVEAFLKGLNDLVPDNLLSMFDENELELLICGTSNYSVAEFRKHHTTNGTSPEFPQMLDWFWVIVSSFTQNDLGRLLQFTTGSSLLPPGGFAELTPKFQITAMTVRGSLPSAHTCFNQLCLPTYDNLNQMHQALMLAITEGSQGFCMV